MANVRRALAQAQAAAGRGEWDQVLTLLAPLEPTDRSDRVAVAFLLVRAALRAGAPAQALETLSSIEPLIARPQHHLGAAILRGTALAELCRFADGLAMLEEATAAAVGEQRFEALLALGRARWRAGRLDVLEAPLDAILRPGAIDEAPGLLIAGALELYGRLELRRYRRPIAARHFRDALDTLAACAQRDPHLRATLLHELLAIAIDTLDVRLLQRVRSEIEATDWASSTLQLQARALGPMRALAELLLGDLDAAWASAFAIRDEAGPGIPKITADLAAAHIARAAGETWTPARLVGNAMAAAHDTGWTTRDGTDARILLALIAEAAGVDLESAQALLVLYDALPAATAPAQTEADPDLAGLRSLARAAVDGAAGNLQRQVEALRRAAARWRQAGNAYGEVQALLALAPVDPDQTVLERADELTRLVPDSWLRSTYVLVAEHARGVQQLTAAERRVMGAIVKGLSTKEIADRFDRSRNTIRNQTRRVYTVMDVRSRSALVARCAALDLLDPAAPLARRVLAPGE